VLFLYFANRRKRRETLDSIQTGKDVLVSWSYSPEDWKKYAEDASSGWIKNREIPGDVFITPENVYVTNGTDEYFYEFGSKRITECSFFHSFLDLRVEWFKTNQGGSMEGAQVRQIEDFRLFVPADKEAEMSEIIAEFKTMSETNSSFKQKFVKDVKIQSLFGDDNY
jgi:hypothetical protein